MNEIFKTAIHESGHALMARHFKLNFTVSLDGSGNIKHDRAKTAFDDCQIALAGPMAQKLIPMLIRGEDIPAFDPENFESLLESVSGLDRASFGTYPARRSAAARVYKFVIEHADQIERFAKILLKIHQNKHRQKT